ncbi:MAG: class I SAM-dependent methyltransferase [Chloroflexia bacterium]|nr:class I SAM-dependent methyltransferase [Chloroflexia bacterium]
MGHDKEGTLYKDYFKNFDYYTLDKNIPDDSLTHIKMDIHELGKLGNKYDLVLLMSVLEHVENPFKVSEEIINIMNNNGYLYLAVPFFYPIHKSLNLGFSDYWRFTDDAIKILFKDLNLIWLEEIPSVIKAIDDRMTYWDNSHTIVSGYCALFKKNKN